MERSAAWDADECRCVSGHHTCGNPNDPMWRVRCFPFLGAAHGNWLRRTIMVEARDESEAISTAKIELRDRLNRDPDTYEFKASRV